MSNDSWYECFLEILNEKYPQKSQLTEQLMDLLSIEREAVYRRLRQDVIFPAHEIAKIASAWHISLDELIKINSKQMYSFWTLFADYVNPSEEDLKAIEGMVDFVERFGHLVDAEFIGVSNTIPRSLYADLPHLCRYFMFKYMYQYGNEEKARSFSEVIPSAKISKLGVEYCNAIKKIANVSYIWDSWIFHYMINDIRYFSSIYLITEEDKQLIKNDLLALLDYLSEVTLRGNFPETQNNVNIYISQVNLDTCYSSYYSSEIKVTRIRAFLKHEVNTMDAELTENIYNWLNLKKRASIQISGVNEKCQIEFFMKQRQLIESF